MKYAKIISIIILLCVFIMSGILIINSAVNENNDEELRQKIADEYGLNPEYIVVLHGKPNDYTCPQLSDKELKSDTKTLLELIFNSDYWFLRSAVMSTVPVPYPEQYENQKAKFNGFQEFSKREDAFQVLWSKYEETYLENDTISDVRSMIESMLLSEDFRHNLSDDQLELIENTPIKNLYSSYNSEPGK